MDLAIKLPTLNQKDKTIAELIVFLLVEEWPLTAKGMYSRITKQHAKEVSFQAVHKAIKKLYSEDILVKTEKYYKLNHDWLEQINTFSSRVSDEYKKKEVKLIGLP